MVTVLGQVHDLLQSLTQEQFVMNPVGVVQSAIGSHARHCLDHVDAFLSAMTTGHLDFDHRERGTPVETDRLAAIAEVQRLIDGLNALDAETLERPLSMSAQVAEDGQPLTMSTSGLRELTYLLSHTIHHNALVGVMARTLGVQTPARFGYAPATLSFMNEHRATVR